MIIKILGIIFICLLGIYILFNFVAIARKLILRKKQRKLDEIQSRDEPLVDDSIERKE